MLLRSQRAVLRVGTHNIMDGIWLPSLLAQYRQQQRGPNPLHVLCVQEAVPNAASAVAAALGPTFAVMAHKEAPRQAIVYDRARLRPHGPPRLYALPLLTDLPAWQRLYTSAGEQRHALICDFAWTMRRQRAAVAGRARGGSGESSGFSPLTVANFHLDAGGNNVHRAQQLLALSRKLAADAVRKGSGPVVACGDTNAFSFDEAEATRALGRMLRPLFTMHGARDAHEGSAEATHFFARAREPKLGQKIAAEVGKLGIDFPRRYDVVVSALPLLAQAPLRWRDSSAAGIVTTEGSDHDLVWAAMLPAGGLRGRARARARRGSTWSDT